MEVAYRELTLGIAALFNDPVTGRGGLPALDRLLHLGQYALGVPGMALSELHTAGGPAGSSPPPAPLTGRWAARSSPRWWPPCCVPGWRPTGWSWARSTTIRPTR
ncbi:hypothetical protein ACFQZ4_25740 [Catellatospora coxensis]